MRNFICQTCGVQEKASEVAPNTCSICTEERQYVSVNGQAWTTLEDMIQIGAYTNSLLQEEENLYSISTVPSFGIGQTAYLVQSENFNLLWDCITYIDASTIQSIRELGGIHAIALSHPHYYSTQVEWAEAFDTPIYIHQDDKDWVTRPSDRIIYWSGESLHLSNGLTLQRIGGHYKGATILEWKEGNHQNGILLTGDIVRVVADRSWVSFMYSYPNLIPLPASTVEGMAARLADMHFNKVYDAFHRVIEQDAGTAVQKSAKRYIDALNGVLFTT